MLPNSSESDKEKLSQVCEAIKRIYASTFYKAPKTLLSQFIQRHEEEKMAVIIMEMTGKKHKDRFYPTFSGVAQSHNYYPVSHMKRNQGIGFIALGLGKTIAEGKKSLRFSPYYPDIISQFYSSNTLLENSQNQFFALDLNNGDNPMLKGEIENLSLYNLDIAEKDGELKYLASVFDTNDNVVRDSLKNDGPRVLTFSGILKYNRFPLAEVLKYFLEFGQLSLGCPVELEFAVNLNENKKDDFSLLQMKPMTISSFNRSKIDDDVDKGILLCKSDVVLGEGVIDNIKNIIYVDLNKFDVSQTKLIAHQIEKLNSKLGPTNPYLLMGPGRWGSSDQWLGIPTSWDQINNAKIIMELSIEGLEPDPSFGSHFFQNLTSLHLGYFTFNKKQTINNINWDFINELDVSESNGCVKLLKLKNPLKCMIDGTTGKGIIFKNYTTP